MGKALLESEALASIWRCMTALDQLVAEFPDSQRRPWGDAMLRDAIARGHLGKRGEAIVEKILARNWDERDRARIEGLPDPGPPSSNRRRSRRE